MTAATDPLAEYPYRLDVVGIVGSRGPDPAQGRETGWTNSVLIARVIQRILELKPDATIISGGAPSGVDDMVHNICMLFQLCDASHIDVDPITVDCPGPHFYEMPAQWHGPDGKGPLNRQAGYERNEKLVRHCTLLLALYADGPMTKGTSHAILMARKWDVPVLIYRGGKWYDATQSITRDRAEVGSHQ